MKGAARARMGREIKILTKSPPPGVHAWPDGDAMDRIEAQLSGPEESPYQGGVFRVRIEISSR